MKQLKQKLLFLLGITLSIVCNAQEDNSLEYRWIQGEWKNTVYGDILDIDAEGLRFIKNALVFDDEEELPDSYERPRNINDLTGMILRYEKVPFQLGYYQDTLGEMNCLALLFEYRMESYPFEMEHTFLGLDVENKLLYYLNQNGEKVYLDKFSNYTFEEQIALELKEKQEELPSKIASNQFAWMHGQWELVDMFNRGVNIDDDSIIYHDHESDYTEKHPIKLQYKWNEFVREVELVLDLEPYEIGVSEKGHYLYEYYDFDQPIYFDKVSDYTQEEQAAIAEKEENERRAAERKRIITKHSIWTGVGIVALVLLFFLVKWIRKQMPRVKASMKNASEKAKQRTKIMSEKAKASKEKVVPIVKASVKEASEKTKQQAMMMAEKAKASTERMIDKSKELARKGKDVGEQSFEKVKMAVKDNADNNQGEKPYTPWLILLLGVYLIFFFDIYIGLLLLIPAVTYLILKKVKPEKAEQLVANIKKKLQPITTKPMLKHGLIALLAGVVVLRTLGIIPGCIIIGLSVVFLALVKFAPAIAQKIDDGCVGIIDKLNLGKIWQNNWVKVAVFALLLLVPILGVRPGQSVYGIAQSDETATFKGGEGSYRGGKGSYSSGNSEVNPNDLYSDWRECINLQIQEIQVGVMTGPGLVVRNICAHKIREVTIVMQSGYVSEKYYFSDIKPGEVKTRPLQLPDAHLADVKIRF